jgi:zinc transporter 6
LDANIKTNISFVSGTVLLSISFVFLALFLRHCCFLFSLITSILSIWVEQNGPTPLFSFGYERFEVLAVFTSTVLAELGSLFIIKESIERMVLEQPEIHT